jgi:hypothetical protein
MACITSSQNLSGSDMRRGSAADAGSAKARMAAKTILNVPVMLSESSPLDYLNL